MKTRTHKGHAFPILEDIAITTKLTAAERRCVKSPDNNIDKHVAVAFHQKTALREMQARM